MKAYNLSADSDKLDSTSSLCPNIETNCCGKYDHKNIELYFM